MRALPTMIVENCVVLTMLSVQSASAYAAMLPVPAVLEAAVVQSAMAVPAMSGVPQVARDASQMSDASVEQRCWRETLIAKHQWSHAL